MARRLGSATMANDEFHGGYIAGRSYSRQAIFGERRPTPWKPYPRLAGFALAGFGLTDFGLAGFALAGFAPGVDFAGFDLRVPLRATASRTSALKAAASTSSPSGMSIARRSSPRGSS